MYSDVHAYFINVTEISVITKRFTMLLHYNINIFDIKNMKTCEVKYQYLFP